MIKRLKDFRNRLIKVVRNPRGERKWGSLERIQIELLKGKTWRYLRYIHARHALKNLSDWETVLIVGGGNGLAEIALAIEFPDKHFHLTDFSGATHSFAQAKAFKDLYRLKNISFGELDILEPPAESFDIVYSIEVLEHIQDDRSAASNMRKIARKYIFCLVPFAEDSVNNNLARRRQALRRHGHYKVGYDLAALKSLFPGLIEASGCYWQDAGLRFREKITDMSETEIEDEFESLRIFASNDLKCQVQTSEKDGSGIWIVSDAT